MTTVKLREVLGTCKIFSYMETDFIKAVASNLDEEFLRFYGERATDFLAVGTEDYPLTDDQQKVLATLIESYYKKKWDSLNQFISSNLEPWIANHKVTVTEYGKEVQVDDSGKDEYTQTNGIAGFDSTAFSDDSNEVHSTTYGKGQKTGNSGQDKETVDATGSNPIRSVNYTLQFWTSYGLDKTVLHDVADYLSLYVYDIEGE